MTPEHNDRTQKARKRLFENLARWEEEVAAIYHDRPESVLGIYPASTGFTLAAWELSSMQCERKERQLWRTILKNS